MTAKDEFLKDCEEARQMGSLRLLMVKWLSGEYDELFEEFKKSGKNELEFFNLKEQSHEH
jgi:hypothetical protein